MDLTRYRSLEEDSARWWGFPFRAGDIVISTRSKSGTTWVQMICALLVFQTPDLPSGLHHLSPWLDWLVEPVDEVLMRLDAQRHRRFIKTHSPLDGIPLHDEVTYVVIGRHPLDMAVSLWHQGSNIDRRRLAELTGGATPASERPPLERWLMDWIEWRGTHHDDLDSLPGVMWHLSDAWHRRPRPNVVLLHYDDLMADLEGQMRDLASLLGLDVPEERWPVLVEAATFAAMKRRAHELAPGTVLRDRSAFFREGTSGTGRAIAGAEGVEKYRRRAAELAPSDMLAWLHRDPD